jgi:lipoate-protein ligase A
VGFRLILDLEGRDPYWQMAIDEAFLILRALDLVGDYVRLWTFRPTSVSIGKFQELEATVDLNEASRLGLPVVRRFTGGGAVVHDSNGEVTWTVVTKGRNVEEVYSRVGEGLKRALASFGLKGEFVPVNDVVVNGRKIVGMAGASRRGAVLVHGTFMYDTDLSLMRVLRLPKEKEAVRGKPEERVITVSKALGRKVSRDEAVRALRAGLCEDCVESSIPEGVLDLASELRWKYTNEGWLRWR